MNTNTLGGQNNETLTYLLRGKTIKATTISTYEWMSLIAHAVELMTPYFKDFPYVLADEFIAEKSGHYIYLGGNYPAEPIAYGSRLEALKLENFSQEKLLFIGSLYAKCPNFNSVAFNEENWPNNEYHDKYLLCAANTAKLKVMTPWIVWTRVLTRNNGHIEVTRYEFECHTHEEFKEWVEEHYPVAIRVLEALRRFSFEAAKNIHEYADEVQKANTPLHKTLARIEY